MTKKYILLILTFFILILIASGQTNQKVKGTNFQKTKTSNSYIYSYLKDNIGIKEDKEFRKMFFDDIDKDGTEDMVVQYYLDEIVGGSGTGFTFISIFLFKEKKFDFLTKIEAEEGTARNFFNIKKVNNGIIYIEKSEYADDDGMCCPSIKYTLQYKLIKDKITKIKEIKK